MTIKGPWRDDPNNPAHKLGIPTPQPLPVEGQRHLHEYYLLRSLIEDWEPGRVRVFCACGESHLIFAIASNETHFHITERTREAPPTPSVESAPKTAFDIEGYAEMLSAVERAISVESEGEAK